MTPASPAREGPSSQELFLHLRCRIVSLHLLNFPPRSLDTLDRPRLLGLLSWIIRSRISPACCSAHKRCPLLHPDRRSLLFFFLSSALSNSTRHHQSSSLIRERCVQARALRLFDLIFLRSVISHETQPHNHHLATAEFVCGRGIFRRLSNANFRLTRTELRETS